MDEGGDADEDAYGWRGGGLNEDGKGRAEKTVANSEVEMVVETC